MTNRPKRGGLRNPPGGRPKKNNVRLTCYVNPKTLENIQWLAGETFTLGEVIDQVVDHSMPASRRITPPNVATNVASPPNKASESGK